MDYDKIIDLDSLTLEDCVNLYQEGLLVVIENGRIVGLEKEKA